jgi:hypothetical protein
VSDLHDLFRRLTRELLFQRLAQFLRRLVRRLHDVSIVLNDDSAELVAVEKSLKPTLGEQLVRRVGSRLESHRSLVNHAIVCKLLLVKAELDHAQARAVDRELQVRVLLELVCWKTAEELEVQLADETNAIGACVREGANEVVVVDRADEDLRVLNRHGHGLLKGCLARVAELRKELGLSWIITPLDSFAYFQLAELAFECELPNRETQLLRKLEEAVKCGVGRGDFEGG